MRCPQHNDAFTVSDTRNGNGALIYPVGLINATEVALAGGWGGADDNENGYYLYSGFNYWTLTPFVFTESVAMVMYVDRKGSFNYYDYSTGGVRPVLNLSKEVLQNGDGSINDPYHP